MNTPNSHQFKNEHEQKLFEQLDVASFAELEKLVRESGWAIDWKTLSEEGVCEVNGKILEGIIWPGSLNLEWTIIESLWKVKKVWWYLFCENVTTLKNLWALEEVWQYFTLKWTNIESLWKLKRVWWGLNCKNVRV